MNYPAELVEGVRSTLERADSSVIDPSLLGLSFRSDIETTTGLLEQIAKIGSLAIEQVKCCGRCGATANAEDQAVGVCPNTSCSVRYEELDAPFQTKRVFKLPTGRRTRDVSWVITAHGMNTDGPWQQEFSWLIANKLKYSAPVLIFKYPVFRAMAVFARTQRLLVADLGERLKAAASQARGRSHLKEMPDVVLHSYGTLLFSLLLLDARFEELRFGRVVLAGSIVPPNYDWAKHVGSGRIEQVVNHCGDKDWVVCVAQYMIPNSGPSGRIGFADDTVANVRGSGFGHGTFFEIGPMTRNLSPGGAWDRFLTYPPDQVIGSEGVVRPVDWSASGAAKIVRVIAKLLVFVGAGTLIWFAMQLYAAIRAVIWAK